MWLGLLSCSGGVMARAGSICCEAGCPEPAKYRGRCSEHARAHETHERKTVATKIDGQRTAAIRRAAVDRWREIYGDWCPGYKCYGHKAHDLTAQHTQALALGGGSEQHLTVLCRRCNSRHAVDVRRALASTYGRPQGRGPRRL